MWILLASLARADDAPAPDSSSEPEVPPSATIVIEADRIRRAREALFQTLKTEGYTRKERVGEYTVFKNTSPWKPQVWVHDDGWVSVKRQPPRVHSPFHTFSDQGSPAEYLLCVIMPTACVSMGGWLLGEHKYERQEQLVLDSTHAQVRALNDAVAREALSNRVEEQIPADLDRIWQDGARSVADRHLLLYTYWDTRTDTEEGDAARQAIENYLDAVVQTSQNPFTDEELTALNTRRQSELPLHLDPPPHH